MNKTLPKTRGFFRGLIQPTSKSGKQRTQSASVAETSCKVESSLRFPKQARACGCSLKEPPQLADTVLSVKPNGIS